MLNMIIGIALLIGGGYFLFKFLGNSPSLKKRDEHSKKNPYDDSNLPPGGGGGQGSI
ncbi:hypothetical protein [Ammoniphilus sp. YIM 78166]|uniref:hypothetical protein n=1 Tax=Ammoniphilus sp. YIM 78166 TaxID=1644106 RepID=UPI00143136D8|nr:hypothetical protein [Ammoniphilus sp. YIM 78166]